jgi:molybdenum cofactor synthesis domain-containing protein
MERTAAVITVSDRSAAGDRVDASGPAAVEALREAGFACADAAVVADGADSVEAALRAALAAGAQLIVTTGGTGVGPRDLTPEGTLRVLTREVPGIAEELRRRSVAEKPAGMLSRGVSGVVDGPGALVVNLPGSPRAVASGMPVVLSVAGHVLDQLRGSDHA